MDEAKDDMWRVGVTEEEAKYTVRWKQMSYCGDH